jgi:hypothetical protein
MLELSWRIIKEVFVHVRTFQLKEVKTMSLTSKITGKSKRDREFRDILLSVEPKKTDYYTLSNKTPFSNEYNLDVPNVLINSYDSALVGTAFDYLARFRIAQFLKRKDVINRMVATQGFNKLGFPKSHKNSELFYITWVDKILTYIEDSSLPISCLFEIAIYLGKLEQIARARIKKENININYLLFDPPSIEVINDLEKLMVVFEENFMIPEIINKKSEVVFNPNFGVGSALVSGADADIFIDGTLYDFKTTQDKLLKKTDNLQLIGYYILNELAKATMSDDLGFDYYHLDIKKIAFYKARFGEVEYYDAEIKLPYNHEKLNQKLKEISEHFKDSQGSLHRMIWSDIDYAKELLNEIRNW